MLLLETTFSKWRGDEFWKVEELNRDKLRMEIPPYGQMLLDGNERNVVGKCSRVLIVIVMDNHESKILNDIKKCDVTPDCYLMAPVA